MEVRRISADGDSLRGVYRLYDPQRRVYSVRLWFDRGRAEKAAQRWEWGMFEIQPSQIVSHE